MKASFKRSLAAPLHFAAVRQRVCGEGERYFQHILLTSIRIEFPLQ